MNIRIRSSKDSLLSTGWGSFNLHHAQFFKQECDQVKIISPVLLQHKVLFLPGGVGRLAAYAQSLGIDATSLDASKVHQEIHQRNYPCTPFIRGNMYHIRDEFSAVYIQSAGHAYPLNYCVTAAYVWNSHALVFPHHLQYHVVYFNSDHLDSATRCIEPEGERYMKRILAKGLLKIQILEHEIPDAKIETHTLNLRETPPIINHKPDNRYQYMMIATLRNNTEWVGHLWCEGFYQDYGDTKLIQDVSVIERAYKDYI